MDTHIRNWNTDFQNLANDMFYGKKEMSYEDLEDLYFQILEIANNEICELKEEVKGLQDDLEDLQNNFDILEDEKLTIEEQLEKLESEQ